MASPPAIKRHPKLDEKVQSPELTTAMECFNAQWSRRSGSFDGIHGAIRIICKSTKHLRQGGGDTLVLFERPDFRAMRILEENGFGVYQRFNPTILYVYRSRVAAVE